MLRKIWALVLVLPAGCQTTPGFRVGWEFTLPPTQNQTLTLHPMTAMPQTAYSIESAGQVPMMQRQYLIAPPVEQAPIRVAPAPVPQRQLLPMPRATEPCQPSCTVSKLDVN